MRVLSKGFIVLAGLAVGAFPVWSEVVFASRQDDGGEACLSVINDYMEIVIAPGQGARIVSFKSRYGPNEWLGTAALPVNGLLADRYNGPDGNEDLAHAAYRCRVLEKGPERFVVDCLATAKSRVAINKRIVIRSGSPVIQVFLGMTNESTQSVTNSLGSRCGMQVSGKPDGTRGFMPTSPNEKQNVPPGWMALLNTQTTEGLLAIFPPGQVKSIDCGNKAGVMAWDYRETVLSAGTCWQSPVNLVLLKGFPSVCHASSNLIAGVTLEKKKKFEFFGVGTEQDVDFLSITHTLSRSVNGVLKDVKLTVKIKEADGSGEYAMPPVDVGELSWEPRKQMQSAKVNLDQRLVCDIEVAGLTPDNREIKERYFSYWPGSSAAQ